MNLSSKSYHLRPSIQKFAGNALYLSGNQTFLLNPELGIVFFNNEYCTIDFENSFFSHIDSANIYIVLEQIESGRDGSRVKNYSVYLQQKSNNEISKLSCSQAVIYQLVNSINSYLAKNESTLNDFIDSYLKNSQS